MLRCLLLLLSVAACQGAAPDPAGRLVLDAGAEQPAALRFYFGSYLGPDGGDPFEAGVLETVDGVTYLHPERLREYLPDGDAVLDADGDGRVSEGELAAFVEQTYAAARSLPATAEAFHAATGFGGEGWFTVELHGVMTTARRRISVREEALRAALSGYDANGKMLLYPVGTAIVGEHVDEQGAVLETTVMQKRGDGMWDYFVYGGDGQPAPATTTEPRALRVPTQCVGCHVGNRAFEPEASFPDAAPDGQHGPRALYVPGAWRDADLVAFFDEHRKRSDHVLGLYNTLFAAKLRAEGQPVPVESLK